MVKSNPNQIRRYVLALLAVLLLFAVSAALADKSGTDGGALTWTLDDAGKMVIEGTGTMKDGTFWQDTVKASEIREVTIGEGITSVGKRAFFKCTRLTKVSLPESMSVIGESAFEGCSRLTEMTLPENITEINPESFSEATKTFLLPRLRTATGITLGSWEYPFSIPGDPTRYIFAHTETGEYLGLTLYAPESADAEYVEFPEGMECIRPGFFENMTHVKKARLPKSMKNLTIACFGGVYRDFVIECDPGSRAEKFAREQGLQYDNGKKQVIGYGITDAKKKVKWIVKNYITAGMSEKQKALVLHRWLINNCHYDEAINTYDYETLVTEGYGVCQAYSEAYFELLKEAGMAVATFSGDTKPATSAGHAWNLVRINGKWYHVDCTWDDPTTGPKDHPCVSGMESTRYFMLNDKKMSADHSWDSHYSADRGRMFSCYDPELKKTVTLQSWDTCCRYLLDWRTGTATVIDIIFDDTTEIIIPSVFYLDLADLKKFKVTGIEAGAFRKNRQIRKVTIGKNVETIGEKAFAGCTNLRTVIVKTSKLTSKAVGKNAFENIRKNAVIKCPKDMLKAYRKIFRARGAENATYQALK